MDYVVVSYIIFLVRVVYCWANTKLQMFEGSKVNQTLNCKTILQSFVTPFIAYKTVTNE